MGPTAEQLYPGSVVIEYEEHEQSDGIFPADEAARYQTDGAKTPGKPGHRPYDSDSRRQGCAG